MACIKWTVGTMVAIIALVMSTAAFTSSWWSETRQEEESKEKTIFYAGLYDFSSETIQTENEYEFVCPACNEVIAYNEENLDYYKRYYCPYCTDQMGYGYESLDDLKVNCPECGVYVGKDATSCNSYWNGCGAEFSEPVVWCDNCDMGITPVEKYYCNNCRDTITKLNKEIRNREGDSQTISVPLSNIVFSDAEKEDGVLNKVGVANVTNNIWVAVLIISGIALIALIMAGINRTKPYIGIISLGAAVLMTLAGVAYFSATWGGAYDEDWKDAHEENEGGNGDYFLNRNPSEQVVSGFWGSKRYQPDDDDTYTDYSWGPGSGWIFGLASACLGLVAVILLFISRNELRTKTGTGTAKRIPLHTGRGPEDRGQPLQPNSRAPYGTLPHKGRRKTSQIPLYGSPTPNDQYENLTLRGNPSYDEVYDPRPKRRHDLEGYPYDRSHQQPSGTHGIRRRRFPPPPY